MWQMELCLCFQNWRRWLFGSHRPWRFAKFAVHRLVRSSPLHGCIGSDWKFNISIKQFPLTNNSCSWKEFHQIFQLNFCFVYHSPRLFIRPQVCTPECFELFQSGFSCFPNYLLFYKHMPPFISVNPFTVSKSFCRQKTRGRRWGRLRKQAAWKTTSGLVYMKRTLNGSRWKEPGKIQVCF